METETLELHKITPIDLFVTDALTDPNFDFSSWKNQFPPMTLEEWISFESVVCGLCVRCDSTHDDYLCKDCITGYFDRFRHFMRR